MNALNTVAGILIGPVLVIAPFYGLVLWKRRQRKLRNERPPQRTKLLRPVGYSLLCRLEALEEKSTRAVLLTMVGAACFGIALVGLWPLAVGVVMREIPVSDALNPPLVYPLLSGCGLLVAGLFFSSAQLVRLNPRFNLPEKYAGIRQRCRAWLDNDDALRKATAGYLAATMALDDYLGELLQALSDAGVLNRTIVIFTSDHGDCLGSHRFYGKDTPFEESISVPLLVRYPAKIPPGSEAGVLFTPIDIMPTVLGLAGVDCPKVDGLDLSGVLAGRGRNPREGVLLMGMTHFCNASVINGMDTWRGLRTQRYTYARYEDGTPWLLYDNEADPFQMTNLAADSNHATLRKELNRQLDRLLAAAGDSFNTKALYAQIVQEKPDRVMVQEFRRANPNLPW